MIVEVESKDTIQHPCVYKDNNFSVYIENSTIGWVLHCYVSKWCLSSYKNMLKVFVLLLEEAPRNQLYAFSNNKKLTKFCNIFGMEVIDEMFDRNNNFKGEVLCVTL